ncbi:MAG TPA: trypsin-like peptidase domain-containing protein [Solirubrobacterales bacterium]|nr:trypsin-like peptidase domain-containing protein [Solirubrobacterales bacterium]
MRQHSGDTRRGRLVGDTRQTGALITVILLALALLAGCGGNEGGGSEAGGSAGGEAAKTTTQVIVQAASEGFDAAQVYREASPGVVTIRSIFDQGAAEGSGFVLDANGRIVTNAHVVTNGEGENRREAKAVYVEFPDRNVVPAEIVGFDPFADVALLEVEPDGFDLHPLELGDDSQLVVGQPVAAIGSPFGEQQSLSIGVVSATDRSVGSLTQFQIEGAIQTDASINPGNSGGPLLDAGARVIGINQQIETNSGANDGVGFAVPISTVKRSLAQLERTGGAEYTYIGVSSQALYPQLAEKLGLATDHGGLVAEVVPDGPADDAGLEGGDEELRFQGIPYETGGDTILAVDGHDVVRPDDLARYISVFKPGDKVTVDVLHDDGQRERIEVTLGKRPVAEPTG